MKPDDFAIVCMVIWIIVGAICGWVLNRHDSRGGLLVYSCVVCAALAPIALASALLMPWDRRRQRVLDDEQTRERRRIRL